MKPVLLCLLWLNAIAVWAANDTLTRAQVYNFNVGDTFDYRYEEWNNNGISYKVSYSRFVVDSIYFLTDTLYIGRKKVSLPAGYYTEAVADTEASVIDFLPTTFFVTYDYSFDSSSVYGGRKLNGSRAFYSEHGVNLKYVDGLGKVYERTDGHLSPDPPFATQRELIYYSKGTEKWGTPYDLLLNTKHITDNKAAGIVYPVPATDMFNLLVHTYVVTPLQFMLCDALGGLIMQQQITKQQTTIERSNLPNGIYYWQLIDNGKVVARGKQILH